MNNSISIKCKTTEALLKLIEPHILSYEIEDYGGPADNISLAEGRVRISVEDNEPPEISWIEVEFLSNYDAISFESTDEDYIQQAADLIISLLTYEIEVCLDYKGKKLSREKYTLINSNGERKTICQYIYFHILGKKRTETMIYKYFYELDEFREIEPGTELVRVIKFNETARAEIYKKKNIYTVVCEIKSYDEYTKSDVWEHLPLSASFYDSEERAVRETKSYIENFKNSQ